MRVGHLNREEDILIYYPTREDAEEDYVNFYGKEYAAEHPPRIHESKERPGQFYISYPL